MRVKSFFAVRYATTLETSLIAAVLFSLPLFEAPKNVLSIFFLGAWVGCALYGRGLGRTSPFELPIACLAAILWIAPLFSDFNGAITPLGSAPRWTLLGVFVLAATRLDYTRGQLIAIFAALMIGGVLAVSESFWVWSFNGKEYPEFRSVGHVNHSSMYSIIPLSAGLGALYLREGWFKVLGIFAIISSLAFLPPSKSLVGGVAVTAILVGGLGVWGLRRWSLRGLAIGACAGVFIVVGALATSPATGIRNELVARVTGNDLFSQRDKILNSALAVWERHPLVGTGWFSFGVATSEEEVRAALAEDGIEYDPATYAHYPHGHNLWTTMLIERGLLGVGLVTTLLLMYFWTFIPLVLSRDQLDPSDHGVAVAAFLVALGFAVAGLGNTTMMNEHGHAGMAFIAVCYGYLRGRGLLGKSCAPVS